MAHHNQEFNDVGNRDPDMWDEDDQRVYDDRWQAEEEAYEERMADYPTVRFSVVEGRVIGRIEKDSRRRAKIVFVARSWVGPAPTHGELLDVRIVHETKPEDPRRGALFVERILPKARWTGGQYAECTACKKWDIPTRDSNRTKHGHFACKSCGELHEIPNLS